MGKYKGIGIVFLRTLLQKAGPKAEAAFMEKINADDTRIYQKAITSGWYSFDAAMRLFTAGSEILYPKDPHPISAFGYDLAKSNINGLYKVILFFTDMPYVMEKSSQLYRLYCDKGTAKSEKMSDQNIIIFSIAEYPEIPQAFLVHMCGYIQAVTEFTGAKNVKVKVDPKGTPEQWRWIITWD
jgi:hypothetical protein